MAERPIFRYFIVGAALASGAAALADETQTYTYDDLGRLVAVTYTGTVNNGNKHSMCFDSADNRTRYRSDPNGAGADCPPPVPVPTPAPSPSPTPPPPPPPPAPNIPPVANADSMSAKKCEVATKDLTANDTDADGDYPLAVTSVGTTSLGDLAILSGGTVSFTAYGTTGTAAVSYTVTDSRGASSSGSLQVTVTNGTGCQ